ncbi:acyl-CoA dehydrogenase [Salinisphaera shabanensis T35B1]
MFEKLMHWMQANNVLPRISDTERQALEAGDVWIDGEFFSGHPDFKRMLDARYGRLSAEEQAFMDGPVNELLSRADCNEIALSRRVPDDILDFMAEQGFFGLIIPKAYGGKGFSTLARSAVMAKVTPHSAILSTYVVIPNTLGAAELLVEYGTDDQKEHYLPRLARGDYLPCFGLTEPTAGSDAASITADAEAFRDDNGDVSLRLNFAKRYITLGPVANLISLACRLRDPDSLLGKGEAPGITVVLIHAGTPGLKQGDRHEPIGEAFPNGPLIGENVVVNADNILGGRDQAGGGWRMLMESLAGGRMVSLPASAIGGMRTVAAATGAYSMVRQQFGLAIGRMEGVATPIGRLNALAYMTEGTRVLGCSAVDDGINPPVVSGVLKAYTTELARQCATDAMDVFSGAGVMQGPNNIIGRGYCSAPVAITVEGANIMTRTLMVFGQGAIRCHPHALDVVHAVENDDSEAFSKGMRGWIGHFVANMGRTLGHGLTRGLFVRVPDVDKATRRYYKKLGWAASRFALFTDLALFFVGGKLKMRGNLTGRYADALAWMLMGFSTLKRYEAEGRQPEDRVLVDYALRLSLAKVQEAFEGIYENFEGPLGKLLRWVALPLLRVNRLARLPDDRMAVACAAVSQRMDAQSERLNADIFMPENTDSGVGRLFEAFHRVSEAAPLVDRIKAAQKDGRLPAGDPDSLTDAARKAGVLNADEANQVAAARQSRIAAIDVDVFSESEFFDRAVQATRDDRRHAA